MSSHEIFLGFFTALLIVSVVLPGQVLGQKELIVQTTYALIQTGGNFTATISGRVFEADNISAPVPNATVLLTINSYPGSWVKYCSEQLANHTSTTVHLLTDAKGLFQYSFQLPTISKAVLYSVEVMKMNYKTVTFQPFVSCGWVWLYNSEFSNRFITIHQGEEGSLSLNFTGYPVNRQVNLSAWVVAGEHQPLEPPHPANLSAGITAEFIPHEVMLNETSTLVIRVSNEATPGNYTIIVQVNDREGGRLVTSLRLVVLPRPANTWEFNVLFLIAVGGSVLLLSILVWMYHRRAYVHH